MVGLEDATTPPAMSRALHAGIAGAKLVEIEGCGHCPQIQARDRFVEAVLAFLDCAGGHPVQAACSLRLVIPAAARRAESRDPGTRKPARAGSGVPRTQI